MKEKILIIIGIIIVGIALVKIDNSEYKKAVKRCGNENNIQINYTNQGDKYYTCKVEK